ncbi:hypothetical protein [Aestuariivita boseongensis]|uniref:hypothetical protein n=1 Tax=Aestuariivita boseongensis TaxID=1470562 RepID=UPI000682DB61|nr:hypothetical protein [Aestuariivita boseongensis]
MLGVVLWSDPREGKAVIWCEDHGELAFYRRVDEGHSTSPEFAPGDLVQFDVETVRHLRFALNPQVVKGGLYRDLPEVLDARKQNILLKVEDALPEKRVAEVIPLFQDAPVAQRKERELSVKTG